MSENAQRETTAQRVARPQQEMRPARADGGDVLAERGKGMVSIDNGIPVVFAPYDSAEVNPQPAQGKVEPTQSNAPANGD